MRIIPKANTLRKGILLYRGIRYRKGFGVHSPFVFNLITKVIEERCQYYSFYDIELIRKQLLFQDDEITYPDRQQKGKMRRRTIGRIVEREAIRPKHGALLFRLANYFKSKHILQFGPSMGLSTLYLTSYASDLKCIALENVPAGHGPRKPVSEAVSRLSEAIQESRPVNNRFVSPAFPRLLYKLAAQSGWREKIRKNGLRSKDLSRRL